jgi:hypothetical protein
MQKIKALHTTHDMKHLFIGTAVSMIQVSLKNHQVGHDYATDARVKFLTHMVTTTSDSKYLFFGHYKYLSQFEINDSSHKLVKRYHFVRNVNCVLITPDNKNLFAGLDSRNIDHIDLETQAWVIKYKAVT